MINYSKDDIKDILRKYDNNDNNINNLNFDKLYLSIIKYMCGKIDDNIQYYNYSNYLFQHLDVFNMKLFGYFLDSLRNYITCKCNEDEICDDHKKYFN